jgi:hypothetical protein
MRLKLAACGRRLVAENLRWALYPSAAAFGRSLSAVR